MWLKWGIAILLLFREFIMEENKSAALWLKGFSERKVCGVGLMPLIFSAANMSAVLESPVGLLSLLE